MLGQKLTLGAAGSGASDSYWVWQHRVSPAAGTTDYPLGVTTDNSGNVYICGSIQDPSYVWEGYLKKLDKDGNSVARVNLGQQSGSTEYVRSIAFNGTDSLFVTGTTTYSGTFEFLIAKYDLDLNLVWARRYGNAADSIQGNKVVCDSTGNPITVGFTYGPPTHGNKDAYIIKWDGATSARLWETCIGDVNIEEYFSLTVDPSDNVYACGKTHVDSLITKFNSAGTRNWEKRIYGYTTSELKGVGYSLGDLIIGGTVYVNGTLDYEVFVSQLDVGTGSVLTNQRFVGWNSSADQIIDLVVDSQGDFYTLASVYPTGQRISLLTKWDRQNMVPFWHRTIRVGGLVTIPWSLTLDSNDNIIVGFGDYATSTTSQHSVVMKIPNDGSLTGTYTLPSGASLEYLVANPTNFNFGSLSTVNSGWGEGSTAYTANFSGLFDYSSTDSSATITL